MIDKSELIKNYNRCAEGIEKWIGKNSYYHNTIEYLLKDMVLEESKVLFFNCSNGDLLCNVKPEYGAGVSISPRMAEKAKDKHPEKNLHFLCLDIEENEIGEKTKFDYIVLNGTLGELADIQNVLKRISEYCNPDTRIIILQYNPIWEMVLKIGEKLKLKMPEKISNWLSAEDIENFLTITGYQVIRRDFYMLFPKRIPVLSFVLNRLAAKLPVINRFDLMQIVVARLLAPPENQKDLTASVVITCRDEKENIEPLVQRIPDMGKHTEIIFVEGHSTDGTREEIQRVIKKYPEKDIVLLVQDGFGQKDAIIKGFDTAKGDFIMLLEADLTTPPEEIKKLWNVYENGYGEYVNGSRLIYRMEKDSMPLINILGNRFFGNIFTAMLGQRFTDTLCGFKAVSKKNYIKIKKVMKLWGDFDPFGDFELIFGAVKNNLKISEVPVKYKPRIYGETKTKPFKHGWQLMRITWLAFKRFVLI